MSKRKSENAGRGEGVKEKALRNYLDPKTASMEEFTLKTAVGVSPAMKKKDNYIVSTLF